MANVLKGGRVTPDIAAFCEELRGGGGAAHPYVVLLGLEALDTGRLLRRVEEGFSFCELERFRRNIGLSMNDLADLIQIKPRTLSRRKGEGRLKPEESDRLLRASRVFGRALQLFEGNAEAARNWLFTPRPALGGVVPLAMARTDVGAREVEDLIGRLEHGVFS